MKAQYDPVVFNLGFGDESPETVYIETANLFYTVQAWQAFSAGMEDFQ